MKTIIYDLETQCPFLKRGEQPLPGIKYASSFQDYENMGIACLCALEIENGSIRPRVFLEDNLDQFIPLVESCDAAIGFNNTKFDWPLLMHHLIDKPGRIWFDTLTRHDFRHVDLLTVAYESAGLKHQAPYTAAHRGYNLDNLCKLNGLGEKSGKGELAPILYQQGKIGELLSYCMDDVMLSYKLFKLLKTGSFISPGGVLRTVRKNGSF